MAATTRGLTFGRWRFQEGASGPHGRARVTEGETVVRDEANAYGVGQTPPAGPSLHGIQYLPDARRHPKGSRIVQWVWAPASLATTRIEVAGLKTGTRIKVLFEDREIVAGPGYFVDDFRGQDLYPRFGGGPGVGYGSEPVALHIYEIP
jgi:hypothetical protein